MSSSTPESVQSDSPVSNAISEIINFLAAELKVDDAKVSSLRSRVAELFKTSLSAKSEKKTSTRKPKKEDADAKHCEYEFGKRSKIPGQKCGGKVCEESTTGLYCKKHIKQEKEKPVKEKASKPTKSPSKETDEKKEPKTKQPKSKGKSKDTDASAVQSLKDSAPVCTVTKNKHGNYEHDGTGFLFDRDTQKVYGKQKSDGSVAQLTVEEIETCRSMGFECVISPNLVSKDDKQAEDEEDDEELEEESEDDENDA